MIKTLVFSCCFVAMMVSFTPQLSADEITFFGDFEDGFGSVDGDYSSDVPYEPGMVAHTFHEAVVGISKFDPTLGTLTDITIFVDGFSPIFYTLGGGMEVLEVDDSLPGYGASISLFGEILLNYEGTSSSMTVFGEGIPLIGEGMADPGTGSFTTPVAAESDGMLLGDESVFGSVDLDDFVGFGSIDTLFIDLFVEETAEFIVDNATASAGLAFDVFDSDSGADDAVIGVTYTFTTVPEPGSIAVILLGLTGCLVRRTRSV